MDKLRAIAVGTALVTALVLTGCEPPESEPIPATLPKASEPQRASKRADSLRTYTAQHGTPAQQEAVERVQVITGNWGSGKGSAFIGTDLSPRDEETARLIIEAHMRWRSSVTSEPGPLGIYDKSGHSMVENFVDPGT